MKGRAVAVSVAACTVLACHCPGRAEPGTGRVRARQRDTRDIPRCLPSAGCPGRAPPASRTPTLRGKRERKSSSVGTLSVDVMGFSQFGPSLDLEIALPSGTSLGLSARWTMAGWLSHYLPDLYPGEGKLHFSYQVGARFRYYITSGKHHRPAGLFAGVILEFFRYKFEEGEGTVFWPGHETQTIQMLVVGAEFGYRWDFKSGFFLSFYGAVGACVVLTFRVVDADGHVETTDRKDSEAVPPVAGRLSLGLGFFF